MVVRGVRKSYSLFRQTIFQLFTNNNQSMSGHRSTHAEVVMGKATESDPCRVGCVDNPNARLMRVVHISDTNLYGDVVSIPHGDILIHSGNFFKHENCNDFLSNMAELDRFFAAQSHKYKIFVAGNNELSFCGQSIDRIRARLPHAMYLQDQSVLIEGVKIYGSPWTGKRRSPANAFVSPYPELGKYWVLIPDDTDLLVTHSPPHRILDDRGMMGCPLLRELVIKQIRPMAHLFGHTRSQTAEVVEKQGVLFSNGSQYGHQTNTTGGRPVVIDLYLRPDLVSKTKTYKLPTWREKETTAANGDTNNKTSSRWADKGVCKQQ